jgi:hypothetical protein
MTTQQKYNILSTYDMKTINKHFPNQYKSLRQVDKEVWFIYEQLLELDPAFIARDLALCEAEILAVRQHTNN